MHLDTHVVVWLYEDRTHVLPSAVRLLLDSEPLVISPMVGFELDLLHEIGRTAGGSNEVISGLGRTVGLTVCPTPFAAVVSAAADLTWTRDPFDRLICAQAVADGQNLLTRDRRIRRHLALATWDERG